MSKTKFTPGPWFVDADFYVYGGDGRKNQGEYFDGVEFPLVCDVESDSRDRTENKANAALIAAAPEMYEFGETTAEVLRILLERLGPKPVGLDAEIKRLAEERIAEWWEIGKKARGEE